MGARRLGNKCSILLALVAAAFALRFSHVHAVEPAQKVARVAYVDPESRAMARWGWPAFWQRMRELGWIEGANLIVEARFADGHVDRLPGLMMEVIELKVDVIFTYLFPGAAAAKAATGTIPIVAIMSDPVGSGFAASFARPGGNMTGLATAWDEGRGGKWLELLQEAVPGLHTVAVISDPADGFSRLAAKQLAAAAPPRGMKLEFIHVRQAEELDRAFALARRHAQAVLVVPGALTNTHRQKIFGLAAKHQLPDMYGAPENVGLGGLIAFGPDSAAMWRRAAEYVDKILRGARPADLPIEQPTHLYLALNLKRAKALKLTIPESILLRADEVIR
jgi:putative ABC transport system substrate-binding protein